MFTTFFLLSKILHLFYDNLMNHRFVTTTKNLSVIGGLRIACTVTWNYTAACVFRDRAITDASSHTWSEDHPDFEFPE